MPGTHTSAQLRTGKSMWDFYTEPPCLHVRSVSAVFKSFCDVELDVEAKVLVKPVPVVAHGGMGKRIPPQGGS